MWNIDIKGKDLTLEVLTFESYWKLHPFLVSVASFICEIRELSFFVKFFLEGKSASILETGRP